MKLWVDANTPPPDGTWEWVTTSEAAVATIDFFRKNRNRQEPLEEISFACKLSGGDNSGLVVLWMIKHRVRFRKYDVHSGSYYQVQWMREKILLYLI